jgi:hypothetical protein
VGILSFLVGMMSFRMFHATFTFENYQVVNDCPTTTRSSFHSRSSKYLAASNSTRTTTSTNTHKSNQDKVKNKKDPKFAYAFLISGCDPSSPLTYRPYLYNILVATKNLVDSGSRADVVVMVQMMASASSPLNSTGTTSTTPVRQLPPTDLQWLQSLYPDTIHIHYLPPLLRDNFYSAQLAKFHILELTQYARVLYLDSDVMPLCNLDYLLELSFTGILQPNVALAWFTEPAHGGFFLLAPSSSSSSSSSSREESYYEQLEAVVERREHEALQLPYPHWDPVRGWGHVLKEEWYGLPQPVETMAETGLKRYSSSPRHSTNWTFHGDFCDQGLLYYWARFHQRDVSILYLDTVLDYYHDSTDNSNGNGNGNGNGDESSRARSSHDVFGTNRSCLPPGKEYLGQYGSTLQPPLFYGKIPHRDFVHFSGDRKPWEESRHEFPDSTSMSSSIKSSTDYWYSQLQQVFQDFAKLYPHRKLPTLPLKYKAPALGRYPTHRSMIGTIQKKLRKRKQQQEREEEDE